MQDRSALRSALHKGAILVHVRSKKVERTFESSSLVTLGEAVTTIYTGVVGPHYHDDTYGGHLRYGLPVKVVVGWSGTKFIRRLQADLTNLRLEKVEDMGSTILCHLTREEIQWLQC